MGVDCEALTAEQCIASKEALVAGGMSLDSVNAVGQSAVGAAEADLGAQLQSMQGKGDVSMADTMALQFKMQQFTLNVQLQSTLVKDFGDAMKSVVQKMG